MFKLILEDILTVFILSMYMFECILQESTKLLAIRIAKSVIRLGDLHISVSLCLSFIQASSKKLESGDERNEVRSKETECDYYKSY